MFRNSQRPTTKAVEIFRTKITGKSFFRRVSISFWRISPAAWRVLRMLLPKGVFTWLLTVGFFVLLFSQAGTRLFTFWGTLLVLLLVAGLWIISWIIPLAWLEAVELSAPKWRTLPYAICAYFFVGALLSVPEARSVRSWWEPLVLTGGAPFSAINGFGLFAAVIAALTQQFQGYRVVGPTVVRGPKLISYDEAKAITESKLAPDSQGFLWGGVRLPFARGTEHFCVAGDPGSGKTKTIQILLKSVLHSIVPGSNRRAIIFDAKTDMFSTLSTFGLTCPVMTLNPMDARGVAWDIAADVPDPMVAIEVANILIPDNDEKEPFFPNAARALLSGVMESLLRAAPGRWTLRDVVLALRYPKRVEHLLKTTEHTRHLVAKYVREERSSYDIASTIENTTRRLSFIAAAWEMAGGQKISLENWLKHGASVLLLGRSPNLESTVAELNRVLLFRLSQLMRNQSDANAVRKGQPERQTWFVIDELRVAGRLDDFKKLLVEGRSKGACVVLGYQDLPGLISVYGEHLAHELVGEPGNKAFLRLTEPKTKEYASSCFGTQEVELPRVTTTRSSSKDGTSFSESFSSQRVTQPVVLPSQFESDLPRPHKQVGLSGFYQTGAVGHPCFAKIEGHLIEAMLPEVDRSKIAEQDQDFIPRFPSGSAALANMSLKEWTEDDLKRLNLEQHPELLETDADRTEAPAKKNWGGSVPDR